MLRFLTSWTDELHTLGYSSGVYSNSLSGIQALVNNYANPADAMPDVIYDALWNGAANTSDPILPGNEWAGHQRIHQYQGGQNATYGGYTVNIDKDYLDAEQESELPDLFQESMIEERVASVMFEIEIHDTLRQLSKGVR